MNPARLVGANRRRHVEAKLPHVGRLLARASGYVLRGADMAIVSSSDPAAVEALVADPRRACSTWAGEMGPAVEALAGYE